MVGHHGRSDYDRKGGPDIADDEPVFVIRGRDRAGPSALRAYASEASRLGASPRLVLSVERHARAMEEFQSDRGSKVPDLED